jgi:hypothetical protein
LKYEVSWYAVCHDCSKQIVFTPMEVCNIDLNYYSNHDVVLEQKFRVYSKMRFQIVLQGLKFLKSRSVGWLETMKFFSWLFHFNSTSKYESHRLIFSLHYNVAWEIFRYRCIEILHGRYFLSPLLFEISMCAKPFYIPHKKFPNDKKNPLVLKLKFRSVTCGVMPLS